MVKILIGMNERFFLHKIGSQVVMSDFYSICRIRKKKTTKQLQEQQQQQQKMLWYTSKTHNITKEFAPNNFCDR